MYIGFMGIPSSYLMDHGYISINHLAHGLRLDVVSTINRVMNEAINSVMGLLICFDS